MSIDEAACYRIREIPTPWSGGSGDVKLGPNDHIQPILPGVDAVIIMTMDTPTGQNRVRKMMRKYGRIIASLCPRAYFQINQGYKRCPKQNVVYPHADLVHATLQVFRNTMKFRNILLLEDDAVFEMKGLALRVALRRVGMFITDRQSRGKPFNTYNLGAIAHALLPCGERLHHRRIIGFMGAAQAVIWSRKARVSILKSTNIASYPNGKVPHIDDRTFIPQLETYAFTYKKPVITQLFVETENSKHWAVLGVQDSEFRHHANRFARKIARLFISILNVDQRTQPGWNIMYGYGIGATVFASVVVGGIAATWRAISVSD